MNDVYARSTINRIIAALEDARDNSCELLALHESALGRTTQKNRQIAEMLESEIIRAEDLIAELTA